MPAYNIETLDDPLVFDRVGSFAGGQVSNVRANLLKENEAVQLINCDVSTTGELSTRRGTVQIGTTTAGTGSSIGPNNYVQGLTQFETPTNNFPLAVTGGKIYKFDGTNWVASGSTYAAADNSRRVHLVQGANKVYIADGVSDLWYWDGTTGATLGGATNANAPNAPSWIVWHSSRLVAVGGPTEPDSLYFSQFLDGGLFDRTKWSLKPGNTGGVTGGFPSGTNDPITGLLSWLDFNLLVFKRESIWVVDCNPNLQISDVNNTIAGFTVKPVHRQIGCNAPVTAAMVDEGDVWFLARDGVRSIRRTLAAQEQSELGAPLSFPVQDIIDRINWNAAGTAAAFFWNNKYFLSLPLDGAATPNYLLVYNFLTNSWIGLWTGWNAVVFAIRNVSTNVPRLMFGRNDGTVYEWLDYVQATAEIDATFQDQGVDIPVTVLTRALSFEEPVCKKQGFNSEFEFNRSKADVVIQVVRDDSVPESFQSFPTVTGAIILPVTLPFVFPTAGVKRRAFGLMSFGPFRELQFKLTTIAKKMVLRAIVASGMVNTLDIEE